jgi:hypothetical protein
MAWWHPTTVTHTISRDNFWINSVGGTAVIGLMESYIYSDNMETLNPPGAKRDICRRFHYKRFAMRSSGLIVASFVLYLFKLV